MKIKEGFKGQRSLVLPPMTINRIKNDTICSLVYVTDIGFYPNAMHHYRNRIKPIDQYILIYCTEGSGWFEIDSKRHTVSSNQYFILEAGKAHCYGADEDTPWTIYWAHFGGAVVKELIKDVNKAISLDCASNSRIHQRISMFEELFYILNNSLTLESMRYGMTVFMHFLTSLVYIKEYRDASGPVSQPTDVIDRIIHYITENIEHHISIEDVSRFSGLSASYIASLFKKQTGYSLTSYINLLKIKEACSLLDNTSMTIVQISHKMGITDPYYFSRLFKKTMGLSPTDYRRHPRV